MWGSMDEEVKSTYGKEYFDKKVTRSCRNNDRKTTFMILVEVTSSPPQVAIMKGYMTGGITDISPVIDSYTDALLDVYPQVGTHSSLFKILEPFWQIVSI